MLIRDKEQMQYIRSAMIRDVQNTIRTMEKIKRGDILPIDNVETLDTLQRRLDLALAVDAEIAKEIKV